MGSPPQMPQRALEDAEAAQAGPHAGFLQGDNIKVVEKTQKLRLMDMPRADVPGQHPQGGRWGAQV